MSMFQLSARLLRTERTLCGGVGFVWPKRKTVRSHPGPWRVSLERGGVSTEAAVGDEQSAGFLLRVRPPFSHSCWSVSPINPINWRTKTLFVYS
jgi:hypothetical protein